MLVLPDDHRILVQIRNVGAADAFWVLFHQHPSEVGIEQALSAISKYQILAKNQY